MCIPSTPSIATVPQQNTTQQTQVAQAANTAELNDSRKKRAAAGQGFQGGTLLTGPSGIEAAAVRTGSTVLGA